MLIKDVYIKFFKTKFFNKILFSYTAVIIATITLLTLTVSEKTSSQLMDREIKYNSLVLNNVNNYFEQKFNNVKSLFLQVYLDNDYYSPEVFYFLANAIDKSDAEYISLKKKFDSYFSSIFSRDPDIMDIIIYKKLDKSIHLFSRNTPKLNSESEYKYPEKFDQINESSSKLKIFPTFFPDYYKKEYQDDTDRVYIMTNNIKSLPTNENLGTMMLAFDPKGIDKAIDKYKKNVKGYILILTQTGEVIYDSSGKYYETIYPYLNLVKDGLKTGMIEGEKCIINPSEQNGAGVIIAGIIPEKQIFSSIEETKHAVYLVALLCILSAIFLTKIIMSVFSKRVRTITDGMKKVYDGNLSNRIPVNASRDEIGDIAASFNRMCDNLKEYINKVYLSDIKQKSAELTALQTQVNPHFLYNTLEAIRMKAIAGGDKEVGNMIYILANLFRSTVKEDTIVEIADEIEYSKSYLELFKIRYGNKLKLEFNIHEDILRYGIIRHLIQPVIENYIVHGFDLRSLENKVNITGCKNGNEILIKVIDNGRGIPEDELALIKKDLGSEITNKSSIGLRNVNERIKLIYGEKYGIDIESVVDIGTTVTLRIASKSREELKQYVQSINSGR